MTEREMELTEQLRVMTVKAEYFEAQAMEARVMITTAALPFEQGCDCEKCYPVLKARQYLGL